MRPAGIFCNKASEFECSVRFRYDNTMANAKVYSVYLVHALKAEMKSCSSVRDRMKKKQWEAMVKAIEVGVGE